MKAWLVREKDERCAEVVFAETRGKAKTLAMLTEACEYVDFCKIEAHRLPKMDKYHQGDKWHMDWSNPQDRIALFNEGGFRCEYVEPYMCQDCSVADYCEDYQEYLYEEGDE